MAPIRSIKAKLTLGLVLVVLVSAGTVGGFALIQMQDVVEHEIHARHQAQSRHDALHVAQAFEEAHARLRIAAHSAAFDLPKATGADGAATWNATTRGQIQQALTELLGIDGLFLHALYIDADGNLLANRSITPLEGIHPFPLIDEDLTGAMLHNADASHASIIMPGQRPRAWVTIFALSGGDPGQPSSNASQEPAPVGGQGTQAEALRGTDPAGYLVAEGLPLDRLLNALDPHQDSNTGRSIVLIDANDEVLAASGSAPVAGASLEAIVAAASGARGESTRVDPLGTRVQFIDVPREGVLAAAAPIPSTSWRLILIEPASEAFAAAAALQSALIITALVALALLAIAVRALAAHFVDPLRRLQAAARRVTEGDYGTQVRIQTRDELSDLGGAFNAMSARLAEEHLALLRQQDELERTVEQRTAALLDKNAELEAFVYAVSHDLKTPLVSLDWLTEDLRETLEEEGMDDDARESLDRMRQTLTGMDALVADLLHLARIGRDAVAAQPIDLNALVDDVWAELEGTRKRYPTDLNKQQPLAILHADPTHVRQLLNNLLSNAVKYGRPGTNGAEGTPPRPVVTIRTQRQQLPADPAWFLIEIQDQGPGVPEEERERIFQLFNRSPDAVQSGLPGTGVGLALARKIVRNYGGDLVVDDAPGGGAVFRVHWPARHVHIVSAELGQADASDGPPARATSPAGTTTSRETTNPPGPTSAPETKSSPETNSPADAKSPPAGGSARAP